jgi:CBS-domain-containing membrane protein
MIVSDVMSNTLFTVRPNDTLLSAVRKMLDLHCRDLMVVDEHEQILGILPARALATRAELGTHRQENNFLSEFFPRSSAASEYVKSHGLHVHNVMVRNVPVLRPEMELARAVRMMMRHDLNASPVVVAGKLVGVLRYADLLRLLEITLSSSRTNDVPSDSAIRTAILTTLDAERWAPASGVEVNVSEGRVSLEGVVFSDDERRAIVVVASATPGAREVHDGLVRSYQVE